MKYYILILLLLVINFGANAQELDKQFLFSIQRPAENISSYNNYNNGPNLNFTFVQSYKPDKAWRGGLGIYSSEFWRSAKTTYTNGDTTFTKVNSELMQTPYLFLGREFRKYLHPDVFIFSGLDIGLGAGSIRVDEYINKESIADGTNYGTSGRRKVAPSRIGIYSFARPYLGARISWGAFIAGYNICMPFDIKTDFNGVDMNANFRHEFTMGLKFKQTKTLSRKFLMFSY